MGFFKNIGAEIKTIDLIEMLNGDVHPEVNEEFFLKLPESKKVLATAVDVDTRPAITCSVCNNCIVHKIFDTVGWPYACRVQCTFGNREIIIESPELEDMVNNRDQILGTIACGIIQ